MSIQNSKDVKASGITGTVCPRTGPYKCSSHPEIIVFFRRGDTFTVCPSREHSASWLMVRSADSVAAADAG
jgi:hypothetical protein